MQPAGFTKFFCHLTDEVAGELAPDFFVAVDVDFRAAQWFV